MVLGNPDSPIRENSFADFLLPQGYPVAASPTFSKKTASLENGTLTKGADDLTRFRERVYRLIAAIPAGKVATYGQIAALAGHPRRARHVGNALAASGTPGYPEQAWHRVINAQGRISRRGGEDWSPEDAANRQMRLLQGDGIAFKTGRLKLEQYRWRPEEEGGALLKKIIGGRSPAPVNRGVQKTPF